MRHLIAILSAVACIVAAPGDAPAQSSKKAAPHAAAPARQAAQVGESSNVARANEWTVGLAGGLLEGTFIRFAAEIAKVLDDGPNLRVLPVVSYGAVGNVEDLLYLKGIDVAITQADVLETFKAEGRGANIGERVHYVARFFLNDVHIYARPEIKSLADLAGKKVGFNTVGSAANLTGGIIFDRLNIKSERVFVNNSIGIEKMKAGELSAIVHVVGKPNDLFAKLKPEPGFHFLPVEYTDTFKDFYVPIEITHEEYPNLIAKGEKIDSISVSAVLAVYNWPRESDRYRRVARFIDSFFAKFEQFQKPPFHPKWKSEINLAASVPGWKRYAVAEEALARMKATAEPAHQGAAPARQGQADASATREQFDAFVAQKAAQRGGAQPNPQEREVLFNEYRNWLEQQGKKPR